MKLFDRIDAMPELSAEERLILNSVRELARDRIATRAAGYDRSGDFPWDNVRDINALGLNAIFVPEAYGGAELGYAAYLACVRELSKACASTGIIWATNFHAIKPLIDFGGEEQKQRLLPRVADGALAALAITEPDAGSDATHMTTRFTPDGDDIVVSGGKTFITNGDVADLILLFGKWHGIDDPRRAISALILERIGAAELVDFGLYLDRSRGSRSRRRLSGRPLRRLHRLTQTAQTLERLGARTRGRVARWPFTLCHRLGPHIFSVHRTDIERCGLLRRMRMLRSGKDAKILHDPASQRAARQHALDRLLDHALGMPAGEDRALAAPFDPAGIAGVPVEDIILAFVAGQLDLFGIDDDDIVAAIHVGRE